ncbi:hypothetical protein ACXPWS_25800 [Mycobacterium sp. BMJ-28]
MLSKMLIALVSAAGAAVIGMPGMATAEPAPAPAPPPPPNIGGYELAKPSEFMQMDGSMYAFVVPGGLTCIMMRTTGDYGCGGQLPAPPVEANAVTGGQVGPPAFVMSRASIYGSLVGHVNPLLPNTKISYKNVTCGTDGVMTTCQNSFDQSGFVLSPAGSFIINQTNPLVDRPEGTARNPFFN